MSCHSLPHTLACEECLFCDAGLLLLLLCLLLLCYRKFHRLHSVCCAAVYSTAPTTTKTKQWRPLYSTSGPNHKNRTQNLFENSFFLFMIQKFSTFLSDIIIQFRYTAHISHYFSFTQTFFMNFATLWNTQQQHAFSFQFRLFTLCYSHSTYMTLFVFCSEKKAGTKNETNFPNGK